MAKNNIVKAGDADMSKVFDALLGEGFQELRLERTVHKAETGVPVVGDIVDFMTIELDERPWPVFVFLTTRPTKGADRKGDIVDVGVGEEILVTASAQIAPVLNRYSRDPEVTFEVALMPKEKMTISGGRTMWTYRVALSGRAPKRREGAYRLRGEEIGQLSNGQAFNTKTGEIIEQARS